MNFFRKSNKHTDRYKSRRAAAMELITKMYDASKGPEYDMIKAAKKLTIPMKGRTLIFDGETDTNALADFYLFEMRFGGKRIVDALAESNVKLTADEREVLEAMRESACSLFEVICREPAAFQVRVRDLLRSDAPEARFTDISLSQCSALAPGDLIFIRLLRYADMITGAGMFFGFGKAHRIYLLNAYEARMRLVAEKQRAQRTYVFFYRKHREFGMNQAYANVV